MPYENVKYAAARDDAEGRLPALIYTLSLIDPGRMFIVEPSLMTGLTTKTALVTKP